MQSSKEAEVNTEKFDFLNGTRGIAALQVVLLHYCAFFLPALARVQPNGHFRWEEQITNTPLYFLIDGQNAVSIFFIMSGFVLTPAFANAKTSIINSIAKRIIRLFLPVAASVIIATLLIVFLGGQHTSASAVTGSGWGAALTAFTPSIAQTLKEIFFNSMLIGYQSVSFLSVLPSINANLTSVIQSPNSPMWTLHIELWGSMLTLAIAIMHKGLNPKLFWPIFLAIALFLGSSRYNLFLIGFVFYINRGVFLETESRARNIIGASLIIIGACISSTTSTLLSDKALSALKVFTYNNQETSSELKTEITALLIFSGIILSTKIQRLLDKPFPQVAGRLSFSIYLIHFPILFTFSAYLFNAASQHFSYLASASIATATGITATIFIAIVFERLIDQNAISLSRRIGRLNSKHKQIIVAK